MRQAGADPVPMLIADAGFDNYNTTIATSKKFSSEKKDLVQRFVNASLEGWAQYLKGGPAIEAANAAIKRDNPDMTDDKIAYAIKVMRGAGIIGSGDAKALGIGALNADRWNGFYKDMADCGALPAGWDVAKLMTTEFVNKKAAML